MLNQHIDYTVWANRRILDAAASLTPEELTHDFGTGDRSILGTLLHVYGGDLIWIERVYGTSLMARPYDAQATLAALEAAWPPVWDRWKNYVAGLTPETVNTEIPYRTFKGDDLVSPAWQIVTHVVNHGTHHRGQVAGFLRALGKTPPVLDLMHFYREP